MLTCLEVLPDVRKVVDVKQHGASAWARAFRVVVETVNDETQVYFMKVQYRPEMVFRLLMALGFGGPPRSGSVERGI